MRRIGLVIAALLIAGPGLAGCTDETSGTPTTSTGPVVLWNPCSEIPDATVRTLELDPASKESGIGGVHQSGWEICAWKGTQYGLTVYSSAKGVDYFKSKPENVDFRPVTIAGRSGEQFRVNGTTKNLKCDLIIPASQGIFQIALLGWPGKDGPDDPCTALNQAAQVLVPVMPK
ncbi:DUF3558 domain-containing protein [Nocardia sp. NPDC047654]|uniref:DUF3558 domain-containing protein n=1 Tax=Nocardia sp. NPDC047654 TaxID=3364314 RepID=UPI00371B3724